MMSTPSCLGKADGRRTSQNAQPAAGSRALTFLAIAAVIAVIAVVVLTSGGSDDEDTESASTTATPTATATETGAPEETATPTPTPTATPEPQPPLLQSGEVTKIRFKEGETVRFRVRSDVDEEIHVHGFDREEEVPANETVTVSFPADITGIFEIEFEEAGKEIAKLTVEPG